MQKKSYLRLGLIALALILSFVALRSSQTTQPSSMCSKMKKPCRVNEKEPSPSGLFLETISRQFFTAVNVSY